MKIQRFITSFVLVLALAASSVSTFALYEADIDNLKAQIQSIEAKQDLAHAMAENARQLGLSEDSEAIVTAKEIWQTANNEKQSLQSELSDLESKQNSMVYAGTFKLTGYCPCTKCCGAGAKGITASGARATEGITVAADTSRFPFGTRLYIEGVGERVVQDRGGAIKNNRLDIFVSTHSAAYNAAYNQKAARVWVIK